MNLWFEAFRQWRFKRHTHRARLSLWRAAKLSKCDLHKTIHLLAAIDALGYEHCHYFCSLNTLPHRMQDHLVEAMVPDAVPTEWSDHG